MQNKALDQGLVVRMKGLEPPSLAALDPKSSASTNFATSAKEEERIYDESCNNLLLHFIFLKNR